MGKKQSAIVARLPVPIARRLRAVKRELAHRHWIEEAEIVASLASSRVDNTQSVLVDVGAHFGTVTAEFLKLNWSVVAYEPDPSNRKEFERRVGGDPRVQLSTSGVSDKPAEHVSLFTSPVSTGVSTLSPFHESHEATTHVDLVTLAEDLRARKVQNVDFLKVDIEGFDFFALKGFDWSYNPRFVLYEFEDRKTVPLGYSVADSSAYVRDLGYHVVYSVWEPIVEYGTAHRWRGLYTDPPADIAKCWGNVLAFRDQQDVSRCLSWYGSLPRRILGSLRRG